MKFKTLDQLKTYAKDMEQTEAFIVGPGHAGHQRAVYQIGLVQILIDTRLPHNFMKPSEEWYWTGDNMSRYAADGYAKDYNAEVVEAYYSDNEYMLIFNKLDDLLAWVFDNRNGELNHEVKEKK